MKNSRQINADAMLICLVFLVLAVVAIKVANASSGTQLALKTIQLVEVTQGSIKQVVGMAAKNNTCQNLAKAKMNVEV